MLNDEVVEELEVVGGSAPERFADAVVVGVPVAQRQRKSANTRLIARRPIQVKWEVARIRLRIRRLTVIDPADR